MSSQKVYVIDVPDQSATQKRRAGTSRWRTMRRRRRETHSIPRSRSKGWLAAFRTYALGPLSLLLWPPEDGRTASVILGVGSLVGAALLSIWWRAFFEALQPLTFAAVIWATSVAIVILLMATAWARAVATSEEAVRWPLGLRRPGVVCAIGLVLPGLGLLIAGRRWKAAFAVWWAGLLVVAVVVLKHWRWLVGDAGGEGAPVHSSIEWTLVLAAGCVVLGILTWLATALDGLRVVSPAARSSGVADGLALVLLVSLAVLVASFQPTAIAHNLQSIAEGMQHHGLRVVPLTLYEAASALDPGAPDYLAQAAALCEGLGRPEDAAAKRSLLQQRAARFAGAVGAELVTGDTRAAPRPWVEEPFDSTIHTTSNDPHGVDRADAQLRSEE
jgi:hypothetical protein